MSDLQQTKSTEAELALAEEEPSVGQLVTSAFDDISTLIKHEVDLAKAELTFSVKNGGLAAGLFAVAGFFALLGTIMLSVAFAYLIHLTDLDLAWCFLIVFGAYMVLAGLLALIGWTRIKFVRPPKRAIEQAKETKDVLTHRG